MVLWNYSLNTFAKLLLHYPMVQTFMFVPPPVKTISHISLCTVFNSYLWSPISFGTWNLKWEPLLWRLSWEPHGYRVIKIWYAGWIPCGSFIFHLGPLPWAHELSKTSIHGWPLGMGVLGVWLSFSPSGQQVHLAVGGMLT